jgi:hypothetical protein
MSYTRKAYDTRKEVHFVMKFNCVRFRKITEVKTLNC